MRQRHLRHLRCACANEQSFLLVAVGVDTVHRSPILTTSPASLKHARLHECLECVFICTQYFWKIMQMYLFKLQHTRTQRCIYNSGLLPYFAMTSLGCHHIKAISLKKQTVHWFIQGYGKINMQKQAVGVQNRNRNKLLTVTKRNSFFDEKYLNISISSS